MQRISVSRALNNVNLDTRDFKGLNMDLVTQLTRTAYNHSAAFEYDPYTDTYACTFKLFPFADDKVIQISFGDASELIDALIKAIYDMAEQLK